MPLPYRRTLAALVVAALPLGGAFASDGGPRNPAAEAASGDTEAMRAVVQDIVNCLRAKGFHPGDPQVQGSNVVIADWNPAWDSPAGRADRECAFPDGG